MIDCATAYTLEFVRSSLPNNARRLLEIGCGDGALAVALNQAGLQVVAIDSDANMVAQARSRGVDARQAEWPDFADGSFDALLFSRSLHHVRALDASVAAAFAAVGDHGRVIVEDFRAEGASPRSDAWFNSFVLLMHRSGQLPRPTDFLQERMGLVTAESDAHDHDLHPSTAIESALAGEAVTFRCEGAAYYFRYLMPALNDRPGLTEALLEHELELIAADLIDPLGRRYVAARHSF
jgi:ubiquinone/menaquinone biosynthesis C-methylase UbiE